MAIPRKLSTSQYRILFPLLAVAIVKNTAHNRLKYYCTVIRCVSKILTARLRSQFFFHHFQIGVHHHFYQFGKTNFGGPTEFFFGFGGVADE